jgi:hypothetical protein
LLLATGGLLVLGLIIGIITGFDWGKPGVASTLAVIGAAASILIGSSIGSFLSLPARKSRYDRLNDLIKISGEPTGTIKHQSENPGADKMSGTSDG